MGARDSFPGEYGGWGKKRSTYLNPVSRLRMGGATPHSTRTSSWHDAYLRTWETVHFTRYLGGQKEYEMSETHMMHWIDEKYITEFE
jgi:hypothetical protein